MKRSEQGSQLLRETGPYFLKKTEGGGVLPDPFCFGNLSQRPRGAATVELMHEPQSVGPNCTPQPGPSLPSILGNHNPSGGSRAALSHAIAPLLSEPKVG